jgi:DNA-binding FadR family transcriptional regulator
MARGGTVLPFRPIFTENTDGGGFANARPEANGVPRRQLGQQTANKIRELILAGEYGPGEQLPTERELAKRFRVSRGLIREAINQLSALNILESRHGAGTFVTSLDSGILFAPLQLAMRIDPELLLHLFEVRRSLEPFGAGLAALRASPKTVSELQALWQRYDTEFDTAAPEELIDIDEAIHATIAKASANPLLTGILTSLASAAHRARLVTAQLPRVPERSREELQALVIAISDRDPWRSEAAMQRHLIRLEEAARTELRRRNAATAAPPDASIAEINQD